MADCLPSREQEFAIGQLDIPPHDIRMDVRTGMIRCMWFDEKKHVEKEMFFNVEGARVPFDATPSMSAGVMAGVN